MEKKNEEEKQQVDKKEMINKIRNKKKNIMRWEINNNKEK